MLQNRTWAQLEEGLFKKGIGQCPAFTFAPLSWDGTRQSFNFFEVINFFKKIKDAVENQNSDSVFKKQQNKTPSPLSPQTLLPTMFLNWSGSGRETEEGICWIMTLSELWGKGLLSLDGKSLCRLSLKGHRSVKHCFLPAAVFLPHKWFPTSTFPTISTVVIWGPDVCWENILSDNGNAPSVYSQAACIISLHDLNLRYQGCTLAKMYFDFEPHPGHFSFSK